MLINDFINFDKAGYPESINWDNVMKVPEFSALEKCEQSPVWHREGNALIHTKNVVAAMHHLIQEFDCRTYHGDLDILVGPEDAKLLMTAALFHDIGKIVTTEFKKGAWHAYGHEVESEKITRSVLWDEDFDAREAVCALVALHMEPLNLTRSNFRKLVMKMDKRLTDFYSHRQVYSININHLFLLKIADVMGSDITDTERKYLDIMFLRKCCQLTLHSHIYKERLIDEALAEYDQKKAQHQKKPVKYGIIMIGIPGAGKNYFLENQMDKFLTEEVDPNILRRATISRDDIREELDMCKSGEKVVLTNGQEKKVTKVYCQKVEDAIPAVDAVIFNDMNIKYTYRRQYHELLEAHKEYEWKWIYIYVEAPNLSTNISRRDGQIPSDCFKRFTRTLDWPKPDEYDMLIISKQ